MAKFYVGQRVRVDCPRSNVHGCETTVRRVDVIGADCSRAFFGIEIDIPMRQSRFSHFVFESHELIPITPPHEACDPELAESIRRLTDSVSV